MQIDWYKKHGFEVSNLISQAAIDRAERDVREAYITPIVGEVEDEVVERAIGTLAFLLILQRSIVATRAGAKIKSTQTSQSPEAWDIIAQEALASHMALEVLRKQPYAKKDAEVLDICKIYFKSNFISL